MAGEEDWTAGHLTSGLSDWECETVVAIARRAAESELSEIRRRLTRPVLVRKLTKALGRPYLSESERDHGRRVVAELQDACRGK